MTRRRRALGVLGAAAATVALAAGGAAAAEPAAGPAAAEVRDVDCTVTACVALTFDDGPGAQTQRLLGYLSDAGVRATFFVLGDVSAARPAALRAIAAAGHEIGSHTWSHEQLPLLSDDGVRAQLTRSADMIEKLTGRRPELMRPPYGSVSARVARIMGERDWPMIEWSVDPEDWKDRDADVVADRVLRRTRPGSIVLLHDIHPTTVAAVPAILAGLADRGYTFVTVTELYGARPAPGREYFGREGAYDPAAAQAAREAETAAVADAAQGAAAGEAAGEAAPAEEAAAPES